MKAKLIWSTLLASISLVVVAPTRAVAQSTPTVIKAKKIYTVTRGTLDNGEILIEAGKIQQVGSKVDAPADARHYSAEVVIPGMIDAHSHMALDRSGGNRGRPSGPVTAEWKAVDHFDPTSPMIPKSPSSVVFSLTPRSIRHWSTDSQIPVTLEAAVAAIRTTLDGAKQYPEGVRAGGAQPATRGLASVDGRRSPGHRSGQHRGGDSRGDEAG